MHQQNLVIQIPLMNTLKCHLNIIYQDHGTIQKNPATYDKIKSEINMQRPFLLNIVGSHSDYANHAVAGYAYTRLKSESTGYYKSFLKVADGLVHSGRYIDIATIQSGAATMHCIGY